MNIPPSLADNESEIEIVFDARLTSPDEPTDLIARGEIDVATAAAFTRKLCEAIDKSKTGRILVDCRGVSFIDSTGLNALVTARHHARALSREIVLLQPPKQMMSVLEVTGLPACFSLISD